MKWHVGVTSSLTFANVGSFAINPTPEQPTESGGICGGPAAVVETPPAVQEVEEEEHAYEAIREDDYPPSQQHQWRKSPQRQFRGQGLTYCKNSFCKVFFADSVELLDEISNYMKILMS